MKEILYMMQSRDIEVENCCLIERYFKRMEAFSFLEHLSFLENSISRFILKLDRNKIYFFYFFKCKGYRDATRAGFI